MGTSLDVDYRPKVVIARPKGNRERYSKIMYFGAAGMGFNGETERLHPVVVMRIFSV